MALPRHLVIASHNDGKVAEIADLLHDHDVRATGAGELGLAVPEETGETFAANALLKATSATQATGLPALADDSGLAVAALDGAPGIHSARWAGKARDFAAAMARLESALADVSAPDAAFHCVLALAWPDGTSRIVSGAVEGTLTFPPRGTNGFGYDPVFVPAGDVLTYGEMSRTGKMATDHRARAFRALLVALA